MGKWENNLYAKKLKDSKNVEHQYLTQQIVYLKV